MGFAILNYSTPSVSQLVIVKSMTDKISMNNHNVSTFSKISFLVIGVIMFLSSIVMADKDFFYSKVAVEGPGNHLSFKVVDYSDLPTANEKLVGCSYRGEGENCSKDAITSLQQDIDTATSPKIRAWKQFLIGIIFYEKRQFAEADKFMHKVASSDVDATICAAALHREADIAGLLRQPEKEISLLKSLHKKYPSYNVYPEEFVTAPNALCDSEWDDCRNPLPVAELLGKIKLLQKMAQLQRDLVSSKEEWSSNYVSTQMALGKIYDEYYTPQGMSSRVGDDTLKIYKKVHEMAPNAPGADFAFLKLRESKFCYEYEGDDYAYNQDVVIIYKPFLEQYPHSPLAPDIQKKYDKANEGLNKLEDPWGVKGGCSEYPDAP